MDQVTSEKTSEKSPFLLGVIAYGVYLLPLLPLIAVGCETFDLIRMQSTAQGVIDDIKIEVTKQPGRKENSRAIVSYSFVVDGLQLKSKRSYPGFVANSFYTTGGDRFARKYQVGQNATVYYDAAHPERCALEYGWFSLPFGFLFVGIGFVLYSIQSEATANRPFYDLLSRAGETSIAFGLAVIGLSPPTIRPTTLHWYVLGYLVILPVAYTVRQFFPLYPKKSRHEPANEPDEQPSQG